jgi:hypothetical protein
MNLFGMRFCLVGLVPSTIRKLLKFCNQTLAIAILSPAFFAVLRTAEISAKQRFVNIEAKIFEEILNPCTEYVDHSYTEAGLRGAWAQLESTSAAEALKMNSSR